MTSHLTLIGTLIPNNFQIDWIPLKLNRCKSGNGDWPILTRVVVTVLLVVPGVSGGFVILRGVRAVVEGFICDLACPLSRHCCGFHDV
jgi:hypothetical protein